MAVQWFSELMNVCSLEQCLRIWRAIANSNSDNAASCLCSFTSLNPNSNLMKLENRLLVPFFKLTVWRSEILSKVTCRSSARNRTWVCRGKGKEGEGLLRIWRFTLAFVLNVHTQVCLVGGTPRLFQKDSLESGSPWPHSLPLTSKRQRSWGCL
jgi:hypothetical protein